MFYLHYIMPEFIWIDSIKVPIIRIGKGSSKFYGNLIRSYSKNYDITHVFSYGTSVNLAIWLIFYMSKEFFINNIIVSWVNNLPSLSFLVHKNITPVDVQTIDTQDGDFYVKFGQNTDISTIKRILCDKTHASIITAGSSCSTLLDMIPYLYLVGFVYYNITVIRTYDNQNKEKAGIKVSIIPYTDEMFSMQSQTIQKNTMQEML